MKRKICIVADVPNWAFDKIAQKLKKELSYKYDIRIDYFNRRTEKDFFYEFVERNDDCDLIHFLNRRILLLIDTNEFKNKVELTGRNVEEYINEKKNKFSTVANDHIDLNPSGIAKLQPIYNKYTKMYYTSSKKIFDIYSSIREFKNPDAMIHDICDEDFFKPLNIERFKHENIKDRQIVIGWVGNSVHSGQEDVDLKGFHTIITPVIQQLKEEGYNIIPHYADRNIKWRTTEEMQEYYSEIDICVCASIHEGTPLPILEAMYCGVPIISTDVGIVSEALGEKQKEFILGDRENGENDEKIKNKLKKKIMELYNDRNKFEILSEENLESIEQFDGGKTIKKFEEFFDACLKETI